MYETCPYCVKVRNVFDREGIAYKIINAERGTPGSVELVELGGKQQVPFMVDERGGVSMYESDDIIVYGREHYGS